MLEGAKETLRSIAAVELEIRYYPVYHGEPPFADLHQFLTKHGFMLFQVIPQGVREFGGNYVEANACYYNVSAASTNPALLALLRKYADAKHRLYGNPLLRLLCDVAQ